MKKVFFLLITAILFSLSAESFRVSSVHLLELTPETDTTVKCSVTDALSVTLPSDMTFIEGLELKLKIPSVVASWQDSVALTLYDDVGPFPSEKTIDYSGRRIYLNPLPSKVNWIFQIPFSEKTAIKESQYISKSSVIPDIKSGFVFIRFWPVMKGVPEELLDSEIEVTVKPVLIDKGKIKIRLSYTDGEPENLNFFIDDKAYEPSVKEQLLQPGIHKIQFTSGNYRDNVQSILVEQAKVTEVPVNLKGLSTTLTINGPEIAGYFVDEKPVTETGKEMTLTEGEHKIRAVLGEYEVVRSISVQKGKSYTVNLNVDLKIQEE